MLHPLPDDVSGRSRLSVALMLESHLNEVEKQVFAGCCCWAKAREAGQIRGAGGGELLYLRTGGLGHGTAVGHRLPFVGAGAGLPPLVRGADRPAHAPFFPAGPNRGGQDEQENGAGFHQGGRRPVPSISGGSPGGTCPISAKCSITATPARMPTGATPEIPSNGRSGGLPPESRRRSRGGSGEEQGRIPRPALSSLPPDVEEIWRRPHLFQAFSEKR